jgi:hypothetical protein
MQEVLKMLKQKKARKSHFVSLEDTEDYNKKLGL